MSVKSYNNKDLTLDLYEPADGVVRVVWRGKSTARDPGTFLAPILVDSLKQCIANKLRFEMDFRQLEYMNSSTITPMIRVLHEAKKTGVAVLVVYSATLKWQELSFSALMIFQTPDKRIEIRKA